MVTITIRLPDDKHARLKTLAKSKKISVNKLIEELSTRALVEFDSEMRFRALVASGNVERGLEILNKIDAHFEQTSK